MAIEKPIAITQNNSSAACHEVADVKVVYPAGKAPVVTVTLRHWATKQDYVGNGAVIWNWGYENIVGLEDLANLEEALVTKDGSPFKGGVVFTKGVVDLPTLKRSKWLEMKNEYEKRVNSPLTVPGLGVVDADEFSQFKMLQVKGLADGLEALGQPVSIPWSMADGSITVLTSAAQVMSMGFALAARELSLRQQRNSLRTLIDTEGATRKQIKAITWDSEELIEDDGVEEEEVPTAAFPLPQAIYNPTVQAGLPAVPPTFPPGYVPPGYVTPTP